MLESLLSIIQNIFRILHPKNGREEFTTGQKLPYGVLTPFHFLICTHLQMVEQIQESHSEVAEKLRAENGTIGIAATNTYEVKSVCS